MSADNVDNTTTQTAFAAGVAENKVEEQPTTAVQTPQSNSPVSKFNELLSEDGKFIQGWTSKLPDGFKDYEKTLSKFQSPEALLSSYASLEKAFSSKQTVKLPSEDAPQEEWDKYRDSVGAPKDPSEYGLTKPEDLSDEQWNGKLAEGASNIAAKYGVPKKALHELVGLYNESIKGMTTDSQERMAQEQANIINTLKSEWKNDATSNFQKAARAATLLGLDPNDSSIGNNISVIKALLKVDSMLNEDKGVVRGEEGGSTYQERYDKLSRSDDYLGKNGQQKQMEALNQMKALYSAMGKK